MKLTIGPGLFVALLLAAGCRPEAPPAAEMPGVAGPSGSAGGNGGSRPPSGGGGSTAGAGGGEQAGTGAGGATGTGGTAGSMPGSMGAAGAGGATAADAAATEAARPVADAGGRNDRGAAATPDTMPPATGTPPPGGPFGGGPITECATPSLARLQQWTAHANTVPATGNLLVREGNRFVARARFVGGGLWSEVVVPPSNSLAETPVNLSASAGFTITYSATADLFMQLRGSVQAHGGDQHSARLPATGGMMATRSFRFVPEDWTFVAGLGRPTFTLAQVLPSATIMNFVGNTANDVVVYDLRFDGFQPACR